MNERPEIFAAPGGQPGPMSARIYQHLRQEIVTLKLPPGTRLSDKTISQDLQVSRTPVREAILRLTDEEMVTVRPNSGTYVSPIRLEKLETAHFIRRAVECAALAEGPQMRASGLWQLRQLLQEQQTALQADDPARFYRLDDDFHRLLLELNGQAGAWPSVDRVKAQIDRVRYLAVSDQTRKEAVLLQHSAIVDALETSKEAANQMLRRHLDDSYQALMRTSARHPDFFE